MQQHRKLLIVFLALGVLLVADWSFLVQALQVNGWAWFHLAQWVWHLL